MSTKKIAYLSLLTALALIIFFVEAQIPPIVPIPGIKLGLANVITLITLVRFGRRDAFAVLALRIALSSILTGTAAGFIYSASGGILSFLTIAVLIDVLKKDRLWAVSIFGAIAHNIGQISVAVILTSTIQIFWYLPILVISAVITGLFTGICAGAALKYLK